MRVRVGEREGGRGNQRNNGELYRKQKAKKKSEEDVPFGTSVRTGGSKERTHKKKTIIALGSE